MINGAGGRKKENWVRVEEKKILSDYIVAEEGEETMTPVQSGRMAFGNERFPRKTAPIVSLFMGKLGFDSSFH